MSLSRDEWAKMWESIKTIESLKIMPSESFCQCEDCKTFRKEIQFIKTKIQEVIGQME